MATYVVMEPPGAQVAEDGARFVRDGFTFVAFLVPLVWLLWHRLWIEAALALAAAMLVGVIGEVAGFGVAAMLCSLLVSIYVGLEGSALRVAALRRRGWTEAAIVEADSLEDAETRYLVGEGLDLDDAIDRPVPSTGSQPRPAAGPALGLLAYPGGPNPGRY